MNLKHAIHLASQGFHILPTHYLQDEKCSCRNYNCHSPGKHPITKNGVLDATTDIEQLRKWWEKDNWNIAVRTGRVSGIWVLDIDNMEDEANLSDIPSTMSVKTPRGKHLYFIYEEGISNRTKIYGLGIDVRGDNGYVLLPPSKGYKWLNNLSIIQAPSYLIKAVRKG
jgi:hypothetical protein